MKINNKIKRLVLAFIVGTIVICFAGGYIKAMAQENTAKNVSIIPRDGDENSGGFSDKDGFWYPGRSLTKYFTIKNNNSNKIELDKISIEIQSVDNSVLNKIFNPDEDIYKEFLNNLTVELKENDTVLYNGTFGDFSSSGVSLKDPIVVPANGKEDVSLSLHFSEQAGNIFQNLRSQFNLSIVYTLKDGGSTGGDITNLPQTGSMANTITFVVAGIFIVGIGLMLFCYKPDIIKKTTFKKGGS